MGKDVIFKFLMDEWQQRGESAMGKLFKKKSIEQLLEQSQNKSLVKTLGAFDLTLLGIGAVIGTGVLVLTGLVAANDAGPAVIFLLYWLLLYAVLQRCAMRNLLQLYLYLGAFTPIHMQPSAKW